MKSTKVFSSEDYVRQTTEFVGIDVQWFATDLVGQIGYFASGGLAPIPDGVTSDGAKTFQTLLDSLLESTNMIAEDLGIPPWVDQGAKVPAVFAKYRAVIVGLAKRGIYCYDCSQSGELGGYFRIAFPRPALRLDTIPVTLRRGLEGIRLSCDFGESESLT